MLRRLKLKIEGRQLSQKTVLLSYSFSLDTELNLPNMYARTIATNIGAIVCMSMYVISIEKINTIANET
jgi:hypothetical protein